MKLTPPPHPFPFLFPPIPLWEGTPLKNDDEALDLMDPRTHDFAQKLSSRCMEERCNRGMFEL